MKPRFLCLGTHHKAGTVWMRRTFRKYTDQQGIETVRMSHKEASIALLPDDGPALCVNWDSRFPDALFNDPRARFLHIIRDPRDILISGHRYHIRPNHIRENWLHRKRAAYGNKSYHESIVALPDRVSQMRFEMDGKHARTVSDMMSWPYDNPNTLSLRYEDLIEDTDCTCFRSALTSMNVDGFDIEELVTSYWRNSLFGGLKDGKLRTPRVGKHISNATPRQWQSKLPREVAEIYVKKFGKSLVALGYERDCDWVEKCLPDAEIHSTA